HPVIDNDDPGHQFSSGGFANPRKRTNMLPTNSPPASKPTANKSTMCSKKYPWSFGPSHGHAIQVITTPSAKPGPNGNARFFLTTRNTNPSGIETTAPMKNATTTGCQPRNAPAIIIT